MPRADTPDCPRCRHAMEVGYLLEGSPGEARHVTRWVAGLPQKSRWLMGLTIRNRAVVPVTTFRCTRCGYLESYARS